MEGLGLGPVVVWYCMIEVEWVSLVSGCLLEGGYYGGVDNISAR